MTEIQPLLTPGEVAEILGVTVGTLVDLAMLATL